jgi:hypothetical protein
MEVEQKNTWEVTLWIAENYDFLEESTPISFEIEAKTKEKAIEKAKTLCPYYVVCKSEAIESLFVQNKGR